MLYTILSKITVITFWFLIAPFSTPRYITGKDHIENLNYPFIIAANHEARIDPVVIACIIANIKKTLNDIRFITYYKFMEMPILGWYLTQMKCFKVKSKQGLGILNPALVFLEGQQGAVGIFPEGVIAKKTEKDKKAKRGVGYLAYHSKSPILPVYIQYHRKKWIPGYWIEVHFGKPYQAVTSQDSEQNLEQISSRILAGIYDIPNHLSSQPKCEKNIFVKFFTHVRYSVRS